MSTDLETVWNYLELSPEEIVVLSAIYETRGDTHRLMAASLLAGPPSVADGWPAWRLRQGFKPAPSEDLVEFSAEFAAHQDSFVAGRAVLSQADAYRWLADILEGGRCAPTGELPEAHACLGTARAPIRICTHTESGVGALATWLARPVVGFHFPRKDEACGVEPGRSWTIKGTQFFSPAIDLLGMSWFEEKKGQPPSGLLLGRFERRAWLVSQRLEPEKDLYRVEVGLGPDRTELMDLEIEVEEEVAGELVFAEHLRLEDTDLSEVENVLYGPPPSAGRYEIGVALPTLGRGVRRSVRLTHRDGSLLDSWQSFNIVESISISLTVNGAQQPAVTSGETRGAQDLVELLGAVERVKKQYSDLRRSGARNRLFDDPSKSRKVLRSLLERAPGELLVVDPFFNDWSLLVGLDDPPPRVLAGERLAPPPTAFSGKARRWSKEHAPFHDRFYLWEGGGVSIGTSAGSKRDRLFRMVKISAAESAVLSEQFALWWSDPGFESL
jgi:hypothetical protein